MNDIALITKDRTFARKFATVSHGSLKLALEAEYLRLHMLKMPSLNECDEASLRGVLLDAATMNLTLSPAQRLAYVVPWRPDAKKQPNLKLAVFTPSYMGLEQMALRSGAVVRIQSEWVGEKDDFREEVTNAGKQIIHTLARKDRGEMTHAYTIASYKSGREISHVEVMTREEIDACMKASARANGGDLPFTWTGPFRVEMWKKCAVRRGAKHWPRTDGLKHVLAMMDRVEPMEFKGEEPITADVLISAKSLRKIDKALKPIPAERHETWKNGLAAALGVDTIMQLRDDQTDLAVEKINERVKKWQAQGKGSDATRSLSA